MLNFERILIIHVIDSMNLSGILVYLQGNMYRILTLFTFNYWMVFAMDTEIMQNFFFKWCTDNQTENDKLQNLVSIHK